jgi:hypothetical protein
MLAANAYRLNSCPVGSWTGDLLRRQQAMQELPKVARTIALRPGNYPGKRAVKFGRTQVTDISVLERPL